MAENASWVKKLRPHQLILPGNCWRVTEHMACLEFRRRQSLSVAQLLDSNARNRVIHADKNMKNTSKSRCWGAGEAHLYRFRLHSWLQWMGSSAAYGNSRYSPRFPCVHVIPTFWRFIFSLWCWNLLKSPLSMLRCQVLMLKSQWYSHKVPISDSEISLKSPSISHENTNQKQAGCPCHRPGRAWSRSRCPKWCSRSCRSCPWCLANWQKK